MRALLLLPALLALASCATGLFGGWDRGESEEHPALRAGFELVTLTRGRGREREKRLVIEKDGERSEPGDLYALTRFTHEVTDGPAAVRFVDLARRLGVSDLPFPGRVVRSDASLTGPGGSGRYSLADAKHWDVPFVPQTAPNAGGFAVSHLVLVPPVLDDRLITGRSPWRLLWATEIVFPDGTMQLIDRRTVSNGSDAARYSVY